jgi:hAT family C-terminal dimerisation region
VKTITRSVYEEDYTLAAAKLSAASPRKPPAPSGDWPSLLRRKAAKATLRERDELAVFWASPCEPSTTDPLQYWQGVLLDRPENRLARMAIDYLSAPASSVDAERAFSRGALTVTHRRHMLSDTSTRNSIVLGTWLRATNLVPKDELIEFFRGKPFRSQTASTRHSVGTNHSDDCDVSDDSNDSDHSSS